MAKQYKRPFGIAINGSDLENLCSSKGYRFDPKIAYNQFGQKATCRIGNGGHIVFDDSKFSDFEIFAVGELSEGEYFISGGQGPSYNNLWPAQRFYNKELYKLLYNWFYKNMHNAEHAKHYYHFKDNTIGDLILKNGIAINSTGNLNKVYEPRQDFDKDDKSKKLDTYSGSISFDIKHTQPFKEIIGIGPVKLYDEDLNNIVISISFVKPNSKRGYRGPNLYGFNKSLNGFPNKTDYTTGQSNKYGPQYNLFTDEKTFKELCDIYNEHEHRVYIPNGKDFTFNPQVISILVLPHDFVSNNDTVNIQLLVSNIDYGLRYNTDLPDDELARKLMIDNVLESKIKKKGIGKDTIKLIRGLIEILQSSYSNVGVEIINDVTSRNKNTGPSFTKSDDELVELPDNKDKLKSLPHVRFINNTEPIYSKAEAVQWKGIPSILAPVKIWSDKEPEYARIGAEVIVIGKDAKNKKYMLFVDNAHKSENFLELPGGGLYTLPNGLANLEAIAKQRLHYKCGLEASAIDSLRDTGKALLLHEDEVAQDKGITWEWSYYRLYQTNYLLKINPDELEYTHDNKEEAAEMGFEGYTANLRWIPIDSLEYNKAVKLRYANIYNIIKNS